MELIWAVVVVLGLLPAGERGPQVAEKTMRNVIASNQCMVKGGLGIINTRLYVVLGSAHNELIVDEGRWVGRARDTREVVVFFQGKVSAMNKVPATFSLSKAVVVSFEGDIVRFFDPEAWSGGFYARGELK